MHNLLSFFLSVLLLFFVFVALLQINKINSIKTQAFRQHFFSRLDQFGSCFKIISLNSYEAEPMIVINYIVINLLGVKKPI